MTTSVVICAYTLDRWDVMCQAMSSVEMQNEPAELLVVIDHNAELFERATAQWPMHRVIRNAGEQGLSGARNTGVIAASHDVIAFLDDDAVAADGWLAALVHPFGHEEVGLTAGFVEPRWLAPRPRWFPEEFLWVVGCSYLGQPTARAIVRNPIGASMAVRRSVFEDVGLFRSGVGRVGTTPLGGEETELAIRARSVGYSVVYEPASVVRHEVSASRCTRSYFASRCAAEGRSKAIITDLSGSGAALEAERTYVARTLPVGVARRIVCGVTGPDRVDNLMQACAIIAGLVATAVGYLRGRIARRRRGTAVDVVAVPPMLSGTDGREANAS